MADTFFQDLNQSLLQNRRAIAGFEELLEVIDEATGAFQIYRDEEKKALASVSASVKANKTTTQQAEQEKFAIRRKYLGLRLQEEERVRDGLLQLDSSNDRVRKLQTEAIAIVKETEKQLSSIPVPTIQPSSEPVQVYPEQQKKQDEGRLAAAAKAIARAAGSTGAVERQQQANLQRQRQKEIQARVDAENKATQEITQERIAALKAVPILPRTPTSGELASLGKSTAPLPSDSKTFGPTKKETLETAKAINSEAIAIQNLLAQYKQGLITYRQVEEGKAKIQREKLVKRLDAERKNLKDLEDLAIKSPEFKRNTEVARNKVSAAEVSVANFDLAQQRKAFAYEEKETKRLQREKERELKKQQREEEKARKAAEREIAKAIKAQQREQERARKEVERERIRELQQELKDRVAADREIQEAQFSQRKQQAQNSFDDTSRARDFQFADQQQAKEAQFKQQQQAEEAQFKEAQRQKQQAFDRQQQEVRKQFEDQILQNRDAQARSFDAAQLRVAREGASKEQIKQIDKQLFQDRSIQDLDLTDQVLDPRKIVAIAKDLAGISKITTDEQRKEVAALVTRIQQEQKSQQAKADELRKQQLFQQQAQEQDQFKTGQGAETAEFQAKQQQDEIAFKQEQRQAQFEFDTSQRSLQQQFQQQLQAAEAQFKQEQRDRDRANAKAIAAELSAISGLKIKARRKGGPVAAGEPYIVGEDGPEIVIPRNPGYVLTARQTYQIMAQVSPRNQAIAFPKPSGLDRAILAELQKLNHQISRVQPGPNVFHLGGNQADTFGQMTEALSALAVHMRRN